MIYMYILYTGEYTKYVLLKGPTSNLSKMNLTNNVNNLEYMFILQYKMCKIIHSVSILNITISLINSNTLTLTHIPLKTLPKVGHGSH